MVDPFPYRNETHGSPELASRVQARLEQLDPDPAADTPVVAPPSAGEVETPDTWVTRSYEQQRGERLELRIDRLDRQLKVLRDQLDQAFDDLEDRLGETDARAAVAEARVTVAETRASVAEARAADAEIRANAAHHRVDELLAELSRVLGTNGVGSATPDLHRALDRLRGPLARD